jgi:sugar lactone lactonase YvrE
MKIKTILSIATAITISTGCFATNSNMELPSKVLVKNLAQNPEGIEYDKNDNTFLLSSLNAKPIIKIKPDGTYKAFTHGEKFPLSTAGLQIDYKNNRLLVAGFNGTELMDKDPKTKGVSFLRIYDLKTGALQKEINLSHLAPKASTYFANDIAVDDNGNAYVTDWYAQLIYKVTTDGKASIFWENKTGIKSGPNGIDFKDGYLLASILTVNSKGLYDNFGLVKIPVSNPNNAKLVKIDDKKYSGFDGMVIKPNGDVVGVTNNQKTPGGNRLITLRSSDNFKTAKVISFKDIDASTTVAVTPNDKNFVINQDFTNNFKKDWNIQEIDFK